MSLDLNVIAEGGMDPTTNKMDNRVKHVDDEIEDDIDSGNKTCVSY